MHQVRGQRPSPSARGRIGKVVLGTLCSLAAVPLTLSAGTVDAAAIAPAAYVSVQPCRLADTRLGFPHLDAQTLQIGTRGVCGIPSNATSVALTLTVVDPHGPGFLTAWPADRARPVVSNVNYVANRAVPNLATVRLSGSGSVCIYSERTAHVIVDVFGAYAPTGAQFVPVSPSRIFDTRAGAPIGKGEVRRFTVAGAGGVPANATAVVLNVAADQASAPGYLTVYPCGGTPPVVSNLNFAPGQALANLVQVRLTAGDVCIAAESATHVFADVAGYFV